MNVESAELKISKDNFYSLLDLAKRQPWLGEKTIQLKELLFEDCPENAQKDLLLDLLYRFNYFSNNVFMGAIQDLAEEIVNDPDLEDKSTQIVAVAADSSSDSSHFVLYLLKTILPNLKWSKHRLVSRFGQAYQTYKKSGVHKNIVLIDEFVGSGKTVIGRIKEIHRVFTNNGVTDYTVKVKAIVSTNIGAREIKSQGVHFASKFTINRGISDYYDKQQALKKIDLMLGLESILKNKHEGQDLPNLGYGKTESLYCREWGNTPNNVFPIFWWPVYESGEERNTVLTRAMDD